MKRADRRRLAPQPRFRKPKWLLKAVRAVGLGALVAPDKDYPKYQLVSLVRERRGR